MDADIELVAQTEPRTLNYWEHQSVIVNFVDNLHTGAEYSATVVFTTVSGNDISNVEVTAAFCKCMFKEVVFLLLQSGNV